jgi:hypothetical protein
VGRTEDTENTVYCIDTSSLVDLKSWRPFKRYPEVWERLDGLIRHGRIIAPRQVLEELQNVDDVLLRWARRRKQQLLRRTTRALVDRVQSIVKRFPGLIDPGQPTRNADPFVVALALEERNKTLGQELVVITEEKYRPGKTRIPHVCEAYRLKYLTIHQLFLFEGWEL